MNVQWHGFSGMRWQQLEARVQRLLQQTPPPEYLIIHLGSNDLTSIKCKSLISDIECSILRFRALLPDTVLVWSDMLQRCYWHGALKPIKIEKARKRLNGATRKIFLQAGGKVISHPTITVKEASLFRNDGVHLSVDGNRIFLNDIQGGMETFINDSTTHVFPQILHEIN